MLFEYYLKRICYYKLKHESHVFKTLYKTPSGGWSEVIEEGDWKPWHNLPNGALCCESKVENYYLIDGKRYDDNPQALAAMEEEIFKPYIPFLMVEFAKRIKKGRQWGE